MFIPVHHPEIEFEMLKFNGGEMHIKLNNNIDYSNINNVVISHRIKNGDDIMQIAIAKDALERKGVKNFDLVMPYVPYARQDRQCAEGESFTLRVFSDIINAMNFNKVWIFDAHSDVAPALIRNSYNIPNHEYVRDAIKQIDRHLLLISPDSGANKKSNKLIETIGFFDGLINCDKIRNVKTGKLSGFRVFSDDLKGAHCLIVDDICDGGRTFIGIAEELKKKNAGDIYLFITHGIFSSGLSELSKYFKKIYCTNSFNTNINLSEYNLVKQINIFL